MKICGVRSVEEAQHAAACGADAIGLNLYPASPRYVSPEIAAEIAAKVAIEVVMVVVDRSEEDLARLVDRVGPTMVQLHGREPAGYGAWLGLPILRAFRAEPGVLEAIAATASSRFLLDATAPGQHGGTGRRVDLALARSAAALGELVLAGGLNPDNVAEAIANIQPWGVDVASGVESSPGVKDSGLVSRFVEAVRRSGSSWA